MGPPTKLCDSYRVPVFAKQVFQLLCLSEKTKRVLYFMSNTMQLYDDNFNSDKRCYLLQPVQVMHQ